MTKATIFGYHGMENFGDDFFLDYILKYCNSIGINEAYVTARKGSISKSVDKSIGVNVTAILPRARVLRGYDKWLLLFLYALKSDVLFFCAGSIFTILPERLFLIIIKMIKFLKPSVKIIAVGVSVGPFKDKDSEKAVVEALSLFNLVIVRDKKSLKYSIQTNVKFFNDLAFTHPPKLNLRKEVIGVALNPYASILNKSDLHIEFERNDKIASCIINSATKYKAIRIFITCDANTYGDKVLSQDLASKLLDKGINVEVIAYDGNLHQFEKHLSGVNKLIASRLHAGFFGLLNGAEVFQLKYAEKIEEFYRGLNLNNISFYHAYNFTSESLSLFLANEKVNYDADFNSLLNLSSRVSTEYKNTLSKELR
ncbi:polysaccharide pyruvyl transferase family protein [Pseudoalteromonas lipolytica]|uniref:Polysaccharide pyruvyl transferase family protein n=1 Tax=Pseudoalteromonas lipolytica TaxID=570156 RepID=A0ABU8SV92_9GAMM